ncbi:hypothetical protein C8R44DRAFT_892105 [Mycena epipterygia]|nr:hypothetical protein C8R44DRAFT_892105 [Mycena epipterygia]
MCRSHQHARPIAIKSRSNANPFLVSCPRIAARSILSLPSYALMLVYSIALTQGFLLILCLPWAPPSDWDTVPPRSPPPRVFAGRASLASSTRTIYASFGVIPAYLFPVFNALVARPAGLPPSTPPAFAPCRSNAASWQPLIHAYPPLQCLAVSYSRPQRARLPPADLVPHSFRAHAVLYGSLPVSHTL